MTKRRIGSMRDATRSEGRRTNVDVMKKDKALDWLHAKSRELGIPIARIVEMPVVDVIGLARAAARKGVS